MGRSDLFYLGLVDININRWDVKIDSDSISNVLENSVPASCVSFSFLKISFLPLNKKFRTRFSKFS
jgi:hypothetical protein